MFALNPQDLSFETAEVGLESIRTNPGTKGVF
jgi:hypothetical protein